MGKITKIESKFPALPVKKKVAAYARVSMETERLHHSLSAQVSYYSDLIQKNPEWEYAGVYADEGITGTIASKRPEFLQLLADCDEGKIDIILTKSISRFARNTVDLLKTVRHLKEIGVEVRFEKEHIHTLSIDGELMLTILASFAQEESRSISDNCKWRIKKGFEQGNPRSRNPVYGYQWEGDELIPDPVEAPIVNRIFRDFLTGKSRLEIRKELSAEGIKTRKGNSWGNASIKLILRNEIYTGDLLLQKVFTVDPIEKNKKKNKGELPSFLVSEHHEPIIDREIFDAVQKIISQPKETKKRVFAGKIKCEQCGRTLYRRKRTNKSKSTVLEKEPVGWYCITHKKGDCITKEIPERCLKKACTEVLGIPEFDEEIFTERIDFISVPDNGVLNFHFKDGSQKVQTWENDARFRPWSHEEKERASAYQRNHVVKGRRGVSCFTTKIKCGCCGANFTAATDTIKTSGEKIRSFRCHSHKGCGTVGLREDRLKELVSEVLCIKEFDGDAFLAKVNRIIVNAPNRLIFEMKDGTAEERLWDSSSWSQEHMQNYKKTIQRKKEETHGEKHNENTGNC